MDLRRAPLLRATLIRFDSERSVLILTFHSSIVDGWSIGLLVREFRTVATAIERGDPIADSSPDLHFADYSLWQQELVASGALDGSRAFWRRRLRGAIGTRVLPDRRDGVRLSGESQIASVLLSPAVAHDLEGFAREEGITLYALAAAALAATLHRTTGEAEIVLGSQVANRQEPAAESVIGPLVNSITLRMATEHHTPLREFLKSACSTIHQSLEHQQLPFETLCGPPPEHQRRELHSVNLVVQRAYSDVSDVEESEPSGFTMKAMPSPSTGALWDLNFFMVWRKEGWRLSCEFDTDLYDRATAELLLASWQSNLQALMNAPGDLLSDCAPKEARSPGTQSAEPSVAATPTRKRADPLFIVEDPSRQITRFNEDAAGTPIIALNNQKLYFPLIEKLGPDRPFIDIQLNHPDGPFDMPRRAFEDYAADAVRLIRWAQPRGPYILCGLCVYGVAAFEAAQQLQRMGEEVTLVALFDSWAPGYRETMPLQDKWMRKARLSLRAYVNRIRQFKAGEIGLNEILWQPILRRVGVEVPEPPPLVLPSSWFDDYQRDSVTEYRGRVYEGDVIVFRSDAVLRGRLFDEQMGWTPFVKGRLNKVDIESGHLDMFRGESAAEIAKQLSAMLAELEGR